jgi:Leucine-rich repeat (LRR) protein
LSVEPAATPPLRELYCAANKVSVIEGLATLTSLTLLELGSNRVRNIEGLEVRELLLRNYICSLAGKGKCLLFVTKSTVLPGAQKVNAWWKANAQVG